MKKHVAPLVGLCLLFAACGNNKASSTTKEDIAVDPKTDWKFGIALWTFHTFSFEEGLAKVDSSGLKYIEPNTFSSAGPRFSNKGMNRMSGEEVLDLKKMIGDRGLICESVYLSGGPTRESWLKEFEVAKALGVKFVTCEPPANMLDLVDSLAGVTGIKVALHEHWKGTSRYWDPDTTLMAIKGHKNIGACADLGHWPKSGINPLDAVKKLGGHIIGIHLKDIAAYNDTKLRDVPVGTGVVDFPAIFRELKKQNFKGHIYIERDAEDLPSNLPSVMSTIEYYNREVGKL